MITDDIETFDQNKTANGFNKFSKAIVQKLEPSIRSTLKDFQNYVRTPSKVLKESLLQHKELEETFKSLKPNKSPCFDNISASVVGIISENMLFPIKHVFNLSFLQGIFPNSLKIIRVTPIFKNVEKHLLTNYIPILVLPCFSKLLESIMYNKP